MTRRRKLIALAILAGILVATWGIYETFISGTTSFPDFIQSLRSGDISAKDVTSVEVVEPAIGHTPFTAKEYDALPRRFTIDASVDIKSLLARLRFMPGRTRQQNHPHSAFRVYLKVNVRGSYFWLDCDLLQDKIFEIVVERKPEWC